MTQPKIEGTGHGHSVMPYGSDGSNWYAILIDSDGYLRVKSEGGDKIEGFNAIVEGYVANTSLAAGANTLQGSAVPAGEVWKITHCVVQYVGTVTNVTLLLAADGLATSIPLRYEASPVSGQRYVWDGNIYLQEGDFIYLSITQATLNDDAYLWYAGLKMNAP